MIWGMLRGLRAEKRLDHEVYDEHLHWRGARDVCEGEESCGI